MDTKLLAIESLVSSLNSELDFTKLAQHKIWLTQFLIFLLEPKVGFLSTVTDLQECQVEDKVKKVLQKPKNEKNIK